MPQSERVKIYESDKNLVLEFNPVVPDDMGNYECRVVRKDVDPSNIAPEKKSAIEIKGKSIHHTTTFNDFIFQAHKRRVKNKNTSCTFHLRIYLSTFFNFTWLNKHAVKVYTSNDNEAIFFHLIKV